MVYCLPKKKDPNKSPLKNQCLEDESFPYAAPAYIFQGTSCSSSVVYTSQKPYSLIYPRRPDPNIFQPSIFQRSALGFQEGVAITNLWYVYIYIFHLSNSNKTLTWLSYIYIYINTDWDPDITWLLEKKRHTSVAFNLRYINDLLCHCSSQNISTLW